MNFEETLRQTLDTLGGRLRAELETAAAQLTAAMQSERERLIEDASLLAARAAAERLSETAAQADVRTREASERLREAGERLREADERVRQAEVNSREEGRAEGFAEGFSSGTDAERDTAAARPVAGAPSGAGLLDAVRSIGAARSLSEVLDTLASAAGSEAPRAAVILARGGRFRGWRFVGFPAQFDAPGTMDLSASDAGVLADAARTGESVSSDNGAPAIADLPPGRHCFAVPIAMSGQVVAVLYADEGLSDGRTEKVEVRSQHLEVLARYAARCLEAITAFKAARVLVERPELPGAIDSQTHEEHHDASAADPSDADAAAQRYARLLVSEIKLYHEAAVIAGRREGDLAARLGAEIARARTLYEQRVPALLRRHTDYFDAELVRTLADGDARLLDPASKIKS